MVVVVADRRVMGWRWKGVSVTEAGTSIGGPTKSTTSTGSGSGGVLLLLW